MGTHVTMSDVARLAGVSQSTVSRVLNNVLSPIPISAATRARVLQAAEELGYTPNPLARGLRGATTGLLGLIVREISDPFFAQIIGVITAAARHRGYNIVLGHAGSSSQQALILSDILDTRACDGFLVLGDLREDEAALLKMAEAKRWVVALCRGEPLAKVPSVNVDNRKGIRLAVEYLTGLGHRNIAFIDGVWFGDIRQRLMAYYEFMEEHSLEIPEEYVEAGTNDPAGGYRAAKALLGLPVPPTAIIASDDAMAIGALKAAADMSYQVPTNISIMGFDDIEAAHYAIPALTTIRQPVQEIGTRGVNLLLDMISGEIDRDDVSVVVVEPELVVRDSCAPPRRR